jgi:predicted aspartyl protease
MARIFIKVQGRQDSATYRALVDTGSTFVVIPENDCINLGLIQTGKKVNLMTGGGVLSAPLFIANLVRLEGADVVSENVEVIGKTIPGIPALLGMNFLQRMDFCFKGKSKLFTLERSWR